MWVERWSNGAKENRSPRFSGGSVRIVGDVGKSIYIYMDLMIYSHRFGDIRPVKTGKKKHPSRCEMVTFGRDGPRKTAL